VGNLALLTAEGADDDGAAEQVERLARAGRTPMVVALDGRVLGVVAVADEVRADAADAVHRLHAAGVRTVMLTGDQERVAAAAAPCAPASCPRTSGMPAASWSRPARWWRWCATGSTTHPPWRPPTSAWPWVPPARASRSRPRTSP